MLAMQTQVLVMLVVLVALWCLLLVLLVMVVMRLLLICHAIHITAGAGSNCDAGNLTGGEPKRHH